MDFQSDSAFDSVATRATVSSRSGLRGAPIETIFDESSPSEAEQDLMSLKDLINAGQLDGFGITTEPSSNSTFDENSDYRMSQSDLVMKDAEHMKYSTPTRNAQDCRDDHLATPVPISLTTASTPRPNGVASATNISSSPPSMTDTQIFHPQAGADATRSSVEIMLTDDEIDEFDEDDLDWNSNLDVPSMSQNSHRRISPFSTIGRHDDSEKRLSLFEWSEQHKTDGVLHNNGQRPKTVHGKQGSDARGGRATGRRGPTVVHLRSQSVPVTRDLTGIKAEPSSSAAKFGTWGLGNKPVSEVWNEDFEFDEPDGIETEAPDEVSLPAGSQRGMKVPQSIIDRQASVHGQFNQVQEFMLLVEELKRLRASGVALQLLDGAAKHLWEDAESIIDLATINDDTDETPGPPAPATPDGFDEFDESPVATRNTSSSVLNDDSNSLFPNSSPSHPSLNPTTPSSTNRPRSESLAQAKSFLQTIRSKRSVNDTPPRAPNMSPRKEKLEFHTEDLKDLVTRAGLVTRDLKEIVRRAEGVSTSPDKMLKAFQDPPFSQIFNRPPDSEQDSPLQRKPGLPKSQSANGYLGMPPNDDTDDHDISGRLKQMDLRRDKQKHSVDGS